MEQREAFLSENQLIHWGGTRGKMLAVKSSIWKATREQWLLCPLYAYNGTHQLIVF